MSIEPERAPELLRKAKDESGFEQAITWLRENNPDVLEALTIEAFRTRESLFSDIAACMQTPDCINHTFYATIGKMMAADDWVYKFSNPVIQ